MVHDFFSSTRALIELLLAFLLVFLYLRISRFSRTADDVVPYIRPIDFDQIQDLLHPEQDDHFRHHLPLHRFKEFQQKRIRLSQELIGRLTHNALVLRQWSWYELLRSRHTGNKLSGTASRKLLTTSVQSQILGYTMRLRLHLWLFRMAVFPFLPTPSFATLLKNGSGDLLDLYDKAKSTALDLAYAYGPEYQERLADVLY